MKKWLFLESDVTGQYESFLRDWSGREPSGGVSALVSERSKAVVSSLQSLSQDYNTSIIGAIFPKLIVEGKLKDGGVLLIWMSEMPDFHLCEIKKSPSEPVFSLVGCISKLIDQKSQNHTKRTLFLIFDAKLPNISSLLDTLYANLGDEVHYSGVNADSESIADHSLLMIM